MAENQLDASQWVARYSDYLFNYTIARVNDRDLAKDLISETFLAGLKSMKSFKGDASERTWLVAILKRKIIDHYRKINSNKGKAEVRITYKDGETEGDWLEQRVADTFDRTAEDQIENEELGTAIYDCLDGLNDKQRTIFRMKTMEHFDTESICNAFGISPSNLWVIVHRARKAMAECLESNWYKQ